MSKKIILPCVLSSLSLLPFSVRAEPVTLDAKLKKYHEVLLKRPQSTNLYEKFQTQFLSTHDDEALGEFLKKQASGEETAGVSGKQIYASYLSQRGREAEAFEILSEAIKQDATVAQVFIDRAQINARILDFDGALADVDKALELAGDHGEFKLQANKLKGRYLIRQGKADEAVAHWAKLGADNPKDQELAEDVIDILMGDGLYEPAFKHAEKLRSETKDPYKKALRTLRVGDILQKSGERDKAVAIYQETLALSGVGSWLEREVIAQIESLYRKEDNLLGLKDKLIVFKEAYQQRLKIHQKLADVHSEVGEHKEARELYLSIIKRSPNDEALKDSLLQALDRAQDHAASKALLESMIKLSPKDAELSTKLAEVHLKLGDKESALKEINAYKQKVAKSPANTLRYASLLRRHDFKQEALLAYGEAIAEYPDSAEVLFASAEYYHFSDKKDEAVKIWDQLANSESTETINRLLETLLFQGSNEKALQLIQRLKQKHLSNRSFVSVGIKVAVAAKNKEVALEFSKISLQLAQSTNEIDVAIKQYTRVIVTNEVIEEELERVNGLASPSLKDKLLLASLFNADGQEEASDKLVAELSNSDDVSALLQVARIYEQRYEIKKSAETLEKILKLPNGLKANYLKQICNLYDRIGDTEEALVYASRWKKLTPNDKQAWLREVELLEIGEGVKPALNALRRGMEKFEEEQDVFAKLASLYVSNQNYTQAKQLYWRLYDESEDLQSRLQWVSELAKTANADGSVEALIDKLVVRRRNSPQSITPIMSLAEVYRVEDRKEERRNLLLEATRVKPDDANIYMAVAKSDLREGKRQSAIDLLQRAQKVDKTDSSTQQLARLYFNDDEYEKGLEELEKVTSAGQDPRSLEQSILDLMQQQAFEEAANYLQKHVNKFPEDGRLLLLSSLIDYELGYVERSFETAMKLVNGQFSMDGVTQGWEMKGFANNRGWDLFGSQLSAEAKTVRLSYRVAKLLDELSGVSQHRRNYRPNTSQTTHKLPKGKDGLQLLSKLQAVRLLEDVGNEKQTNWKLRLKDAGVKHLELWQAITTYEANDNRDIVTEVLESNLDDPLYLEMISFQKLNRADLQISEKLLAKLQEKKAELSEYQQKILPYLVKEGTSKKDHEDLFIKDLKKQEKLDPIVMSAFFSLNANALYNQQKELREDTVALIKKFAEQNPVDEGFNPYQQGNNATIKDISQVMSFWFQYALDRNTLLGDDYDLIITQLNKENKLGTSIRPSFSSFSGRQQSTPSINNVLRTLQSMDGLHQSIVNDQDNRGEIGNIDIRKLHEKGTQLTHPIFRYLVAQRVEPDKNHLDILVEAKKDKKYAVDALLLEASWYADNTKEEKSIVALEQARKITRDISQRDSIDYYLVEVASKIAASDQEKELGVELRGSVQAAARRLFLRRKVVKVEAIEAILASLGMEGERQRYITKSRQSVRTQKQVGGIVGSVFSNNSSIRSNSSNASIEPWEKARELVAKNQVDSAARLLARTLRGYLKSQQSNRDYYLKKIEKTTQDLKIENQVLALLSPQDSVSPRKWLTYYRVAELFEKKEEMAKSITFLQNLSVVPKSVRMPLAKAMIESNPERAMSMLKSGSVSAAFSTLTSHISEKSEAMYDWNNRQKRESSQIDSYLKSVDFLLSYLKSVEVIEFTSSHYSNMYSSIRGNYNSLSNYYKKLDEKTLSEYEGKIQKQFQVLDLYALRNSRSAEFSFKKLYENCTDARDYKNLETELLASMNEVIKFKKRGEHNFYGFSDEDTNRALPNRARFLGQRMLDANNGELINDHLMREISSYDSTFGKELRFYKEHLFLSDKVLLKKINTLKNDEEAVIYKNWDGLLLIKTNPALGVVLSDKIIRAYSSGKIQADEHGFSYYGSERNLIGRIRDGLIADTTDGTRNAVAELLDQLAEKVVKKNKAEDKLESWLISLSKRYNGEQDNDEVTFSEIISGMASHIDSLSVVISSINKHDYPYFISDVFDEDLSKTNNDVRYTAERMISTLEKHEHLVGEDKIKVVGLPVFSANKIKAYSTQYPQIGWQLDDYDPTKQEYSELKVLCKLMRESCVPKEHNEFIKKLELMQGDKLLPAQMIISLFEDEGVDDFLKTNKQAIIDSSPAFKEALVTIYGLNYLNEDRKKFSRLGILDSLPIEKLQKDTGGVEAFLALKAPLKSEVLEHLEETALAILIENVEDDVASSRKILNHFVDLVRDSPESRNVFTDGDVGVSPLQIALIDGLISSIRKQDILPKHSLPLIYTLYKREDMHSLFLTQVVGQVFDHDWVRKGIYGDDQKEAVNQMFIEFADVYAKTSDEDERNFYKASWFGHMRRGYSEGKIPYAMWNKKKSMEQLFARGKGPEQKLKNEFFDYARILRVLTSHRDGLSTQLYGRSSYDDARLFRLRNAGRLSYLDFLEEIKGYSLKLKILIANSACKNGAWNMSRQYADEMVDFCVDTFIEAVEVLPEFHVSNDIRFIAALYTSLKFMDEPRKLAFAKACATCLRSVVAHLEQGGDIHKNYIENLAICSASDAEATKIVAELVDQSPDVMQGLTSFAHALLEHGYIEQAYKVLNPAVIMKISSNAYKRISYSKKIEQNLPKLLAKYQNLTHKATAASVFLLLDEGIDFDSHLKPYSVRTREVVALAKQAEPKFPINTKMEFVKNRISWASSPQLAVENPEYFKGFVRNSRVSVLEGDINADDYDAYNGLYDMEEAFNYSLAIGDTTYLDEHIAKGLEYANAGEAMNRMQAAYLIYLLRTAVGTFHTMWAEGIYDEQLKAMLPQYRQLMEIKIKAGYRHRASGYYYSPRVNMIAEFFHSYFGEEEAWKKFMAGHKPNFEFDGVYMNPLTVVYGARMYGANNYENRGGDAKKFLLKILNEKSYQKYVVSKQERGGMVDYLYDLRLCNQPQALEIFESDKITIHEPSLKGIMASDRLHLAAIVGDVDGMMKHLETMKAAFEEHPIPKKTTAARLKIRVATYFAQYGKKNEAIALLPESLPAGLDDMFKGEYEKLRRQLKLKKNRGSKPNRKPKKGKKK